MNRHKVQTFHDVKQAMTSSETLLRDRPEARLQAIRLELSRDPPETPSDDGKERLRNELLGIVKDALSVRSLHYADQYSGSSGTLVLLAWATDANGLQKFVVIKIDETNRIDVAHF